MIAADLPVARLADRIGKELGASQWWTVGQLGEWLLPEFETARSHDG